MDLYTAWSNDGMLLTLHQLSFQVLQLTIADLMIVKWDSLQIQMFSTM